MTTLAAPDVAGLLRAISARLTPPPAPLHGTKYMLEMRAANSDVRLAIAAILGKGLNPTDVAAFTALLSPEPPWTREDQAAEDAKHAGEPWPPGNGDPHSARPPATHCPVCGGKLDGNGEHDTRSGAHIPPAGVAL